MNDLHFGVCIGIDRYPGFPGRDLGSAARDAKAFRSWLTAEDGGGLPEANAHLIVVDENEAFADVTLARPKMHEVVQALDSVNERIRAHLAVDPQDWERSRIYIYAAGHGVAIPNGEGAVLMADAKPKVLGWSIDLSLYADWYLRCGLVREVVVFVDCCREIADGVPPGVVLFQQCRYPQAKGTVRYIAYASRWGDAAFEPLEAADPDAARGYFTSALIDGLRGAAEEAATGEVTAASLSRYVQEAVERLTRDAAPFPQRAEMNGDLGVPLVLRPSRAARPPAPARHTATIRFPPGLRGTVAVVSGDATEWGRWRAEDGPWTTQPLPDSFYRVVAVDAVGTVFQNDGLFSLVGTDADVQL